MGITSHRLQELELVDRIVEEPLGGAHSNIPQAAAALKQVLIEELGPLLVLSGSELADLRYRRLRQLGAIE